MVIECRAYTISAGLVPDLCPAEFLNDRVTEPRYLVSRPISAPKRQLVYSSVNGSVCQSVSRSTSTHTLKPVLNWANVSSRT